MLQGLKVTATVSLIGIPLGILVGTLFAYMADAKYWSLRLLARIYVELVRNIPFLIVVYLLFFGLPKLGVQASSFAIAVGATAFYTAGYFSEVLRAALRSVPAGQVRAALSMGFSGWQVQRYVVVPQTFGFLIPPTTSLTIMMFKDTAIFSVTSLPELTYQSNLMTADTFAYLEVLGAAALLYWLSSIILDALGQTLESRVRR
ncbi:Inner membrane amino-acid ABC transporter permease protein YecS [compost metagenome]